MPPLDLRTLALLASLTFFGLGAYLLHFRHLCPFLAGIGKYSLGALAGGLGMVLLYFRGRIPDLFSVALPSVLAGMFVALVYLGLAACLDRAEKTWRHALALALYGAGLIYFTYVEPSLCARVALLSLVVGGYCLACAWLLLRWSIPVFGSLNWPLLFSFAGIGLFFAVAFIYSAFLAKTPSDYARPAAIHGPTFLASMVGGFLILTGLVFLGIQRLELEARQAREQVRQLRGLLPICANCKRIRDDQGYWHQVEEYVKAYSDADFTHGICPECVRLLYPDLAAGVLAKTERAGIVE